MNDDARLLNDYATTQSDAAFAELARRYVDFVYSSAHRQVRDAHLADDVTQAVFIVLASKAKSVPRDRPMASWLLKVTSYCAANARRTRTHRETHERRAAEMAPKMSAEEDWESLAPLLDEGLSKLRQADREALLLKFFEKKTLQQVGEALGVSEDAAQKRVTRAVEKLRDFFARRGVTVSSAALSTELISKTIQSAPAKLAQAVQVPAAASASSAAAIAKGAIILMTAKQTSAVVLIAAILLLGIGGTVAVVNHLNASPPPQPVAATTTDAAVTTTEAPLTAVTFPTQFSDGSVIEVLGISDPSAKPQKWWTANGLPAPAPNIRALVGAGISVMPGQEKRQFAMRLTGNLTGHNVAVRLTPYRQIATGTTSDGKTMTLNCVAAIQANSTTTTLQLGLSRGNWEEDESFPVATSQPANADPNREHRITNVTADGDQTLVAAHIIHNNDRDERILVEQIDGKQVSNTQLNIDAQNNGTYKFPCRKEQVARVVILSRPIEWVEMNNVALRGDAEPTSIQVNRVSAPADHGKL